MIINPADILRQSGMRSGRFEGRAGLGELSNQNWMDIKFMDEAYGSLIVSPEGVEITCISLQVLRGRKLLPYPLVLPHPREEK